MFSFQYSCKLRSDENSHANDGKEIRRVGRNSREYLEGETNQGGHGRGEDQSTYKSRDYPRLIMTIA